MDQLREKIASLSADFASGVMAAIRECSLEELIGDRFGGARAAAPVTDKPRRGRPPGPAKKSGRLARRSAEDIDVMADKIVAYVKQAGVPMRAEAVRAALAIDKKEWMKPLQLALDTKGLKKQGNKRATEYTVGAVKGGAATTKASKPAKAKPAKKAKAKPAKAKAASKKAAPAKKKAAPKKAKPAKAKAKSKSNGAAKPKAPKKSKKSALAALDKHIESNGASPASPEA
jgi:hypothetical protein